MWPADGGEPDPIFAGGLAAPSSATVIDNRGEEAMFTDGPFLESKEYLAGYSARVMRLLPCRSDPGYIGKARGCFTLIRDVGGDVDKRLDRRVRSAARCRGGSCSARGGTGTAVQPSPSSTDLVTYMLVR